MSRSSLLALSLVLAAASSANAQQMVRWIAPPAASMLFAFRTGSASAADTSHGIRPTQWQKGLVIGGVIGGVGLGAFIFAFCEGLNESGDSCSG
ncbi:MAG TPA: hypothetical protein VD930_01390, partial [Gemmatimonadales bacterium]|nr:hypothetical protein [Gemmatimonadales bacterium]